MQRNKVKKEHFRQKGKKSIGPSKVLEQQAPSFIFVMGVGPVSLCHTVKLQIVSVCSLEILSPDLEKLSDQTTFHKMLVDLLLQINRPQFYQHSDKGHAFVWREKKHCKWICWAFLRFEEERLTSWEMLPMWLTCLMLAVVSLSSEFHSRRCRGSLLPPLVT